MKIQDITSFLETVAPLSLQESYDNAGLITGNPSWECSGAIVALDATEEVIMEAVEKKYNLVIAHHPIIFGGLKKIALCGGAGSFLIGAAIAAGADFYVTSDVKYHEFFDANGRLVIADIGHWESEQYTIELLDEVLRQKFPTFAVLKTGIKTNPVQYFTH